MAKHQAHQSETRETKKCELLTRSTGKITQIINHAISIMFSVLPDKKPYHSCHVKDVAERNDSQIPKDLTITFLAGDNVQCEIRI